MEQKTNLCSRLMAVAGAVVPGQSAADVGLDHALLSFYLLQNRIVRRVVGIELSDGPYLRAKEAISASPWEHQIDLRQGDGLVPLLPGEVENIIIAGIGGDNIAGIISRDWDKAESFCHFVLQPMSRPASVRNLLAMRGWPIVYEDLVQEKGQYFIVITTRPGSQPYSLSSLEAELGPVLLKTRGEKVLSYLLTALGKYIRISEGYSRAGFSPSESRCLNIKRKIIELEGIICRLQ